MYVVRGAALLRRAPRDRSISRWFEHNITTPAEHSIYLETPDVRYTKSVLWKNYHHTIANSDDHYGN